MGTKNNQERVYELRYTGYLTESQNVFLHYGYNEWTDVSECKMKKLKTCCKAEVKLPAQAELNFCFRDEDGKWDNNYGNNYFFIPGVKKEYTFVEIVSKEPKEVKKASTKTQAVKRTTKSTSKK